MSKLKSLCIYCGSRVGSMPAFETATLALADTLAARGIRLVYGGGGIGLMGIAAKRVMAQGGEVVGIIPEFLQKLEVKYEGVTQLILTDSMHERKQLMFDMSDAFLVLPGGIGTLDETVEMMTWRQLQRHSKPIALVNLDGYWDPFVELIDHVIDNGFAEANIRDNLIVASSIEDALSQIEAQL
ncbi:MAG: TIGR00730 family Rossman fold protein [Alphaproteobacteria bacterium]|nr:MAG: TIGR00730 family Rossman fold protein [Alphaproteobacteria bacterium]